MATESLPIRSHEEMSIHEEKKAYFDGAVTPSTATPTTVTSSPSRAGSPCPVSPTNFRTGVNPFLFPSGKTAPFENFVKWQKEVKPACKEAQRSTILAYRFCEGMNLMDWQVCRVVLVCIRMLVACQYDIEDVELVFALALTNLRTARSAKLLEQMGVQEKMLVAILHVYCAHSLVFDEFAPLSIWHEWLFIPFCNMATMSAALRKVCALHGWKFNQPGEVVEKARAEVTADVEGESNFEVDPEMPPQWSEL